MKTRLKEIVKEKGITTVALADMIGVSRVTISNLVNDKTAPSLDTIEKIAEALNVPVWQFFASPQEVRDFSCPNCGTPLKITIDKAE